MFYCENVSKFIKKIKKLNGQQVEHLSTTKSIIKYLSDLVKETVSLEAENSTKYFLKCADDY